MSINGKGIYSDDECLDLKRDNVVKMSLQCITKQNDFRYETTKKISDSQSQVTVIIAVHNLYYTGMIKVCYYEK